MPTQTEPPTAAPFVPQGADLETLRKTARDCKGCDLYEHATQTVFGDGAADARLVLVGEQPGDVEDREGLPFVGPAGRVLGPRTGRGGHRAAYDVRHQRGQALHVHRWRRQATHPQDHRTP